MSDLFTKVDLERLVRLFAEQLNDVGVSGTVSILGGAAIALLYHTERTATADIDALFPADDRIAEIICTIGKEEGLPNNWINNQVALTLPFQGNSELSFWREYLIVGSIVVQIASAEYLLALKLNADRGRRDRPDIEALIPICKLSTIEEIDVLFESYFPQEVLKPETRAVVEKMLFTFASRH